MTKIIKKIVQLNRGEWFKYKDRAYQYSGKDGRGHCVREDGKNEHLPLNSYVTLVETSRKVLPYNSSGKDWADNLSDEQIKKSVERFGPAGSRESLRDVADWAANSDPEVTKEIFKGFQDKDLSVQEIEDMLKKEDKEWEELERATYEKFIRKVAKNIDPVFPEFTENILKDIPIYKPDNESFSAAQEEKPRSDKGWVENLLGGLTNYLNNKKDKEE